MAPVRGLRRRFGTTFAPLLRDREAEVAWRGQVVLVAALLHLFVLGPAAIAVTLALGRPELALATGVSSLLNLTIPLLLWTGQSVTLAGHAFILNYYGLLGFGSLWTGGLDSGSLFMLPPVALFAVFLCGLRGGLVWTGLCLAQIAGVAGLHASGFDFPSQLAPPLALWNQLAAAAFFTLATATLGVIYARLEQRQRERVQAESEERQRTTQLLHSLLDGMPTGVVIADAKEGIAFLNSEAERLFGYRETELLGRPMDALLPENGRGAADPRFEDAAIPSCGRPRVVAARHKDGHKIEVEVTLGTLRTQGATLLQAAVRDASALREEREQLLQSRKLEAIGRLAAGIAHEINTPAQYVSDNVHFLRDGFSSLLSVLGAYAELLDPGGDAATRERRIAKVREQLEKHDMEFLETEIPKATEQALEGLERVARIVQSMKLLSRSDGEEKQDTDLNQVVEDAVTVCRNRWKYVAEVELDLDPELPPVPCRAGQIGQVVVNLVVNAADAIAAARPEDAEYAQEKGWIRVATRNAGPHVELSVEDSGGGVPEAIRDRIFEPFFTTKEVGQGTGQGLAIVRSIVTEQHGGSVRVQDGERGARFVVGLPLQRLDAPESQDENGGEPLQR